MSKSAPSSSLEDRLDGMQRELAAHQRRLVGRTRFTGFLAAIVLVALAVYFYIGYTGFGEVTEPKTLVALVEVQLDDNLPAVRKTLQDFIIKESPGWAAQISGEVQTSLPEARKQLENYIVEQMDTMLDATNDMTEEHFRGYLKKNRPLLEQGFQELAASPDMAEQTMKDLIASLDKQLSQDMQVHAVDLFETLTTMKRKLVKLKVNKGLNQEQQLERHVLELTRRLQLENVEPGTLEQPAASSPRPRTGVAAEPPPPTDEPAGDGTEPGTEAEPAPQSDPGDKTEGESDQSSDETASPPEPDEQPE